jgi:lysophospholipase L1-like esterase
MNKFNVRSVAPLRPLNSATAAGDLTIAIIGDSLSTSRASFPATKSASLSKLLAVQIGAELQRFDQTKNNPCEKARNVLLQLRSRLSGVGTPQKSSVLYDIAMPGATVKDALNQSCITQRIRWAEGQTELLPGLSQVQIVESIAPSCVVVWIGSNDLLQSINSENRSPFTPPEKFEETYRQIVARLKTASNSTVLCTLPSVSRLPYLIPLRRVGDMVNRNPREIPAELGLPEEAHITLGSLPEIAKILAGTVLPPLKRNFWLSAAEVDLVHQTCLEYNKVIRSAGSENGANIAEIYSLTEKIHDGGIAMGSSHFTTSIAGGIFCSDGIHPTRLGYTMIANTVLKEVNAALALTIQEIPISTTEFITPSRDPPRFFMDRPFHQPSPSRRSLLPLREGLDYYREGNSIVFTHDHHLNRGYCCLQRCKHCPYSTFT